MHHSLSGFVLLFCWRRHPLAEVCDPTLLVVHEPLNFILKRHKADPIINALCTTNEKQTAKPKTFAALPALFCCEHEAVKYNAGCWFAAHAFDIHEDPYIIRHWLILNYKRLTAHPAADANRCALVYVKPCTPCSQAANCTKKSVASAAKCSWHCDRVILPF